VAQHRWTMRVCVFLRRAKRRGADSHNFDETEGNPTGLTEKLSRTRSNSSVSRTRGSGEAARILIRFALCQKCAVSKRVTVHAGGGFIQRQLTAQRKLPDSATLTVQRVRASIQVEQSSRTDGALNQCLKRAPAGEGAR
jgi:hypothetical protein